MTDAEPRRERKERVLHTRISQQLAEDIGRMAEDLRVPVSNLVRNVLEEVFSVVETVTDNVGELIEDVMDEAGRARRRGARAPREDAPEVLGWQELILAREGSCSDCAAPLARGARAYLGVTASGASSQTLCADCLDARRRP
ncbi:MAG TPA: hypothetical protein VII72_17950 [Myxococcota bacterium]|jgi:hypothetical protein